MIGVPEAAYARVVGSLVENTGLANREDTTDKAAPSGSLLVEFAHVFLCTHH